MIMFIIVLFETNVKWNCEKKNHYDELAKLEYQKVKL